MINLTDLEQIVLDFNGSWPTKESIGEMMKKGNLTHMISFRAGDVYSISNFTKDEFMKESVNIQRGL